LDDLAGTWEITEFSMTSAGDPAVTFDLIALGGSAHLGLQASGNFTGTAVIPGLLVGVPQGGPITLPLAGVVRLVDGVTLRIDFIPEIPPVFTALEAGFTLEGNSLTVVDEAATYDFDNDGAREPARFRAVLFRT
jgi:hypothetical protein